MGKNRRQERLRQRREQPTKPTAAAPARPQQVVPAWRYNLDQWGGPGVLVVGVVVIAIIGWLAWSNRPVTVSTDELRGEPVTLGQATHVAAASELQIPEGVPPAGGPHFINPLPGGVYNDPVDDGRAIHSLEHGLIWITYKPDAVSESQLKALREIAEDRTRDVLLSPRAQNRDAVVVTSWGRRQILKAGDTNPIKDFISTNVNRSPEPGVR